MNNLILALLAITFAVVLVFAGVSYLERTSVTRVTVATDSVADVEQMMADYQNLRINLGRRPTIADYQAVYGSQSPNSSYSYPSGVAAVRPSSMLLSTSIEDTVGAPGWTYAPGCGGTNPSNDCFYLRIVTNPRNATETALAYQAAQLAATKETDGTGMSQIALYTGGTCTIEAGCTGGTAYTNPSAWPATVIGPFYLSVSIAAATPQETGSTYVQGCYCTYGDSSYACGATWNGITSTPQPCPSGATGTEEDATTTTPYICAGDNNPQAHGSSTLNQPTDYCSECGSAVDTCAYGSGGSVITNTGANTLTWSCTSATGGNTAPCSITCGSGTTAYNGACAPDAACSNNTTPGACATGTRSGSITDATTTTLTWSCSEPYGPVASGCSYTCPTNQSTYQGACYPNCPANTASTTYGAFPTCAASCNPGYKFDSNHICQPDAACGSGSIGACTVGTQTAAATPGPGNTEVWTCTATDNGTTSSQCSFVCPGGEIAVDSNCQCPANTATLTYSAAPACAPSCVASAPTGGSISAPPDCTLSCPSGYTYDSALNSCYENGLVNPATNGQSFYTEPSGAATLCSVGTPTTPVLSGNTWTWQCQGINPGSSPATGTAYQELDAVVNPATEGNYFANGAPSGTSTLCSVGTPAGPATLSNNQYSWICDGINGGQPAIGTAYQYETSTCQSKGLGGGGAVIDIDRDTGNWLSNPGCCAYNTVSTQTTSIGGQSIPGCDTPPTCGPAGAPGAEDPTPPYQDGSAACSPGSTAIPQAAPANTWEWVCNRDGVSSNLCQASQYYIDNNCSDAGLGGSGTIYFTYWGGPSGFVSANGCCYPGEINNGQLHDAYGAWIPGCDAPPQCGPANGVEDPTAPHGDQRCSSGTSSGFVLSGNSWTWNCDVDGTQTPCSAPQYYTDANCADAGLGGSGTIYYTYWGGPSGFVSANGCCYPNQPNNQNFDAYGAWIPGCDTPCPANTATVTYGSLPSCTPSCVQSAPANGYITAAPDCTIGCNSGYTWNGSACQANCPANTSTVTYSAFPNCTPSCVQSAPANGYITAPPSCSIGCNSGYTWNGSACQANCPANTSTVTYSAFPNCTPSCVQSAPANGYITAVPDCTIGCNGGYTWNGSSCIANGQCNTDLTSDSNNPGADGSTLCTSGTASAVSMSNGQWIWTCGGSASCSATITTPPLYAGCAVDYSIGSAGDAPHQALSTSCSGTDQGPYFKSVWYSVGTTQESAYPPEGGVQEWYDFGGDPLYAGTGYGTANYGRFTVNWSGVPNTSANPTYQFESVFEDPARTGKFTSSVIITDTWNNTTHSFTFNVDRKIQPCSNATIQGCPNKIQQ